MKLKEGTKVIVNGKQDGRTFVNKIGIMQECPIPNLTLIEFDKFKWYFEDNPIGRYPCSIVPFVKHKEFTDEEYEALLV